jgi:arsenate reductase
MLEEHPNELLLFYNSKFDNDRKIFAHAEGSFKYVRAFDVALQPIKGTLLEEIAMRLNLPLSELLRESNAAEMPELGNDSDYIKVIQHNPDILRTPIAISDTKVIIVESPGDLSKV